MRKLSKLILLVALLAMIVPTITFAHGDFDKSNKDDRGGLFNGNDRKRGDDADGRFHHGNLFKFFFESGTVTAVGSDNITIQTKNKSALNVDISGATLFGTAKNQIELSDINVGDKVWLRGSADNNSQFKASTVYVVDANIRPAKSKGTVSAINDNELTVATKHDGNVSVTIDENTKVVNADGTTVSTTDVTLNSKVKVFGWWDKTLNTIKALWIKIK